MISLVISKVNSLETNWLKKDWKKSLRNLWAVIAKPLILVMIRMPMNTREQFETINSAVVGSTLSPNSLGESRVRSCHLQHGGYWVGRLVPA